jgi:hypothetical protein
VTKLETGWGPLVERGGPSVEKVGEWCVESRHLQGCSLHLCQLRTDGLTSANKYWTYQSHASDMGPVSLLACHRQELGLSLLLHWLAWERNWVRTHGSIGQRAGDCVGSPFSREQWDPFKSIGDSWKIVMRWPREIRMVWDHTQTELGMRVAYWSGFLVQDVYRFESSWLKYNYRLFVTVIT